MIEPPDPLARGRPERCCEPGLCKYRPDLVAKYVKMMRALEGARMDVGEGARSVIAPRRGYDRERRGGSASRLEEAEYAVRAGEIKRAMARGLNSYEAIAVGLCPFALDDDQSFCPDPSDVDLEWINTAEAIKRVGWSRASFYQLVRDRGIRRRLLTGLPGSPVVFAAPDIDRLCRELAAGR